LRVYTNRVNGFERTAQLYRLAGGVFENVRCPKIE